MKNHRVHLEILVEDQSGARALEVLVPKIVGDGHTFKITSYQGLGHLPKNLKASKSGNRKLLNQLPRLLAGHGQAHAQYPPNYPAAVVVVCDLDSRDRDEFLRQLEAVLDGCNPRPVTRFCLAIEEGEAWLLGDLAAVRAAYPDARDGVLNRYENDAICGTWECLADAVYQGGSAALSRQEYWDIGREKSLWAENIAPHIRVGDNRSPSFQHFRRALTGLTGTG